MDKIKILDVFGQFKVGVGADAFSSGSAHQFIFPRKWEVEGDWKIYVNDVRSILNDIPKCYASWCTNEGWWIAAVVKNEQDARQGYAIVSICLGDNLPLYGLDAVRTLDTLTAEFMKQENWSELRAESLLNKIEENLAIGGATLLPSASSQPTAVRRYKTERELHELFDNLGQSAHKRFSRILYVADSDASRLTQNSYKDITAEPIVKGYEIECAPADGKISATKAMKGDEITLTFNNFMEMPVTTTIIAGQESKYVTYDGNKIIVKKHNILRLIDENYFTIRCVDELGHEITGWNARPTSSTVPLAIDGNKCYYVKDDKVAQIGISLQGYQPASATVKLLEIPSENHVETVTLKRYATTGNNSNAQGQGQAAKPKGPSTIIMAGLATAIIILIVGLSLVFFGGNDEKAEDPIAAVNTDSIQQVENTQKDIAYIKGNDVIDVAYLKTDDFKALVEYIANGDIAFMCSQLEKCYGAINGNSEINDKLRQIYGKIGELKSAGQHDKVEEFAAACRKSSFYKHSQKGTQINLNTIQSDLAKITAPKPAPINTPGPGKTTNIKTTKPGKKATSGSGSTTQPKPKKSSGGFAL